MPTVLKRDNSRETYSSDRVLAAIQKAACSTHDTIDFSRVIDHVNSVAVGDLISVERIHDIVEKTLMKFDYMDTAKAYILYRSKRNRERDAYSNVRKAIKGIKVETPWGPVGYITYRRTYSRVTDANTPEEFADTCVRVITACQTQLGMCLQQDEIRNIYKDMMSLKFCVAGRFLWQLGTATVSRYGLASLQNCAFVKIDHPVKPFKWVFDSLMLGIGVGFNIQRENVSQLPPVQDAVIRVTRVDRPDADFIIPDSREGWVSFLEKLLESYFYKGESFTYSTILIRSKGTPIKGFGGVASGPEELCKGVEKIQAVLDARRGEQLTSVDCLDIVCIIGSIVVAGNIRRSALIALGDYDDIPFLQAKRWDTGTIPNWRSMSNNSVVCSDTSLLPDEFWDGYNGNGEPYGLVNIDLARRVGRLQDGEKYPDPDVAGTNPCGEQSLANYETCCLAELFLPNLTSFAEAKRVMEFAYRICKHSLLLDCHQPDTEQIVHKNTRMGIGITGYQQASETQKSWLDQLYVSLRNYDIAYSRTVGSTPSIKLTTVKPSGTLSLLAGVTPGAHPGIFQYFIRRIAISSSNPLVNLCRKHGFKSEFRLNFDGTYDTSTVVVEFPCKFPPGTRLAKACSAIDQLEDIRTLQTIWSDNSVSVTVYYRKEELDDIKRWLEKNYSSQVKAVSFLLHYDSGFKQMPYEEITREEYSRLVAQCVPITSGNIDLEDDYTAECSKGVCPIK